MNMLKDNSRNIQFEAFHVFKVCVYMHAISCNLIFWIRHFACLLFPLSTPITFHTRQLTALLSQFCPHLLNVKRSGSVTRVCCSSDRTKVASVTFSGFLCPLRCSWLTPIRRSLCWTSSWRISPSWWTSWATFKRNVLKTSSSAMRRTISLSRSGTSNGLRPRRSPNGKTWSVEAGSSASDVVWLCGWELDGRKKIS